MGHGYSYDSLAEELNIGRQTVSDIVAEVTDVINTCAIAANFPEIALFEHIVQFCLPMRFRS